MVAFNNYSYTTDNGTVVRIHMSTQSAGVSGQGTIDATLTDGAIWAFCSNPGSRRKRQLNARGIILSRLVGTSPNQFKRRTFLPIVTKTAWDAFPLDSDVTLGSLTYKAETKIPEG